ncbi:MAG: tRNA lysidine(34) synthetase TilS [Oscillospiraceae bacterium]|nr:tRNA lysidine(34) synthetase TilS [Oscillospiraceae bacterium]
MYQPKDIMKRIIDFCEKYDMLPKSGIVLCAVSGGKDSMCLLEMLRELAPGYGFELRCAHFDHRLRGGESDRDRDFVEAYCRALGIVCYTGSADVSAYAAENGLGTEEAARELRYSFLEKTAGEIGAERIATAHTADDNAETLIMNLVRGSGLRGLCGIPPVRGKIIRPLLQTTGKEVLAYLEKTGVPHVEDSTNEKDDYSRNRLRHRVIPELKSLNEGFDENLIRCAELIREDEEYLSSLARDFIGGHYSGHSLPVDEFLALPKPVSARVLRLIVPCGLTEKHVQALRGLASGEEKHAYADIPGLRVTRDYDRLFFAAAEKGTIGKRELKPGTVTEIHEAGLEIACEFIKNCKEIHNSFNIFFFKSDSICGNIFVKSRSEGEKFRLSGRNCTKTLKKLFSEAKLNGEGKTLVPVIYDEAGVIAVFGFGVAERCAPDEGDSVVKLTFRGAGNK